ncbi:hypothetical protein C2E21_2660 [Chlorella sorokiniana]|uniref:TPX2 C-terminal domain-containing protein n=1 Tax=Chlorella sorokiniana TaxID=3076 RepID=A0A2P6TYK6_CHLSO|nr:hypothetical protein C2E21_2660 [Chlorella sorokiniana]|eukprot:PRW59147.1 hypothetical protein C2E21_2660 [Chlorella sorokiniana]
MEPTAGATTSEPLAPPSDGTAAAAAAPAAPVVPPAAASEASLDSAAQLSAASGSLAAPSSGCSSRDVPWPSRSPSRFAADASRSPSLHPPALREEGSSAEPDAAEEQPAEGEAAVAVPEHAVPGAEEAPAAAAMATAEVGAGEAAGASGGASTQVVGSEPPPVHSAPGEEQQTGAPTCVPIEAAAPVEAEGSESSSSTQDKSSDDTEESGSLASSGRASGSGSPPVAASPSRLSVAQLLKARELAAAAGAAAVGGSLPTSALPSARSPSGHSMRASSPSPTRLAACRSSPSLSARCRSPAAAPCGGSWPATAASGCTSAGSRPGSKASPVARCGGSRPGTAPLHAEPSGASSRGSLASGRSTLLQTTASYVAGRQETRSRKEQRQLAAQPSAHKPQATTPRPFKLSCDLRAQCDYTRSSDAFKMTREERETAEVEQGRQRLAAELSAAKERCTRTLSAQPQRPGRSEPHAPEFQEFQLQSAARHAAYAQKFADKVAEERRREDELHTSPSHGSRPSSRIGALHGPGGGTSRGSTPCSGSPTGGSPPLLATQERAARHAELSAERGRREEAEAAEREAERLAQLSVAEREEEAERAAHRFKARPMPDFSRPVFSPDKRKAKPATSVKEFKFSTRFSAPAAGTAGSAQDPPSRSGSRLRNEGSGSSL